MKGFYMKKLIVVLAFMLSFVQANGCTIYDHTRGAWIRFDNIIVMNELICDVKVESIQSTDVKLRLIRTEKLDSGVFGNTSLQGLPVSVPSITYDTSSIELFFSGSIHNSFKGVKTGDTLFNVFLMQIYRAVDYAPRDSVERLWVFSLSKPCLLLQSNPAPSFSIKKALDLFDTYMKKNNKNRGIADNEKMKLGPVYHMTAMPIGCPLPWELRAYSDSDYWYFEHMVAKCSGITDSTTIYRVASNGKVDSLYSYVGSPGIQLNTIPVFPVKCLTCQNNKSYDAFGREINPDHKKIKIYFRRNKKILK